MEYFAMIAIAIAVLIGLQFTKEKDITRIEWSAVSQFIGFMIVVTVLRTWAVDFLIQLKIMEFLPTIPYEITSHKWTKFSLAAIITFLFAMGHGYQGWSGILFASLYPWFISKRYGEKYGFGTVMICHIMYDSFTCLWLIVLPYLGVGRTWFHF